MTAVVLVAAGSGQRLGAGVPKALVTVGGATLIEHCVSVIANVDRIDEVVVVVPGSHLSAVTELLAAGPDVSVVAGASSRDGSVRSGLAALVGDHEHVLIHDAARPLTPAEVYDRVIDALQEGASAVVPAIDVADTIKRQHDGVVVQTVDRSELVAVQTPQGFDVRALRRAHETGGADDVTDDAMRLERASVPVRIVEGSPMAFKITGPFDLRVAEALQEGS